MKAILSRSGMTLGIMLVFSFCRPTVAGTPPPPASAPVSTDNTFEGIATAVNEKGAALTVKQFLLTRTFNVADDCKVVLQDKPSASLSDLRVGERVRVHYEDVHGVLITHQIVQENLVYSGHIDSIDPAHHTLVLEGGVFSQHFVLSKDCAVYVEGGKSGSVDRLRPGQTVSVTYAEQNGNRVARRIDRPGTTFVGTIRIIDADRRVIKAQSLMGTKKFNLADGCRISARGTVDTRLNRLNLGDEVTFGYEDKNGVLVATWIGLENAAGPGDTRGTNMSVTLQTYPAAPQ